MSQQRPSDYQKQEGLRFPGTASEQREPNVEVRGRVQKRKAKRLQGNCRLGSLFSGSGNMCNGQLVLPQKLDDQCSELCIQRRKL